MFTCTQPVVPATPSPVDPEPVIDPTGPKPCTIDLNAMGPKPKNLETLILSKTLHPNPKPQTTSPKEVSGEPYQRPRDNKTP